MAAVCLRSWKRRPLRAASRQARLQAVRQSAMGRSGSMRPFSQAGKTKCSGLRSGEREAHKSRAAHAGRVSGTGLPLPALLSPTLRTRSPNGFGALYDGLENVAGLFVRADGRGWLAVLPAEDFLRLLKAHRQ